MTLPLVLLHGFSAGPESWDRVRALIGGRSEVIAPALVGHGAPEDDAAVTSFESEVERVAGLIARHGAGFHVVGYSLGGRIALGLLVRHPGLFASATLIGAQPGLQSEDERRDRRLADEHLCQILEKLGTEVFVRKWESIPLFASQERLPVELLAAQRAMRLARDPSGLARSLRTTGLGAMPSYWDALPSVRVPTTLIAGSLDQKFSAIATRMAERIPSSTLEIVPGAGHNVVLEDPAAIARHLRRSDDAP